MAFRVLYWTPLFLFAFVSSILYLRLMYIVYIRRTSTAYSSFFFKCFLAQGILDLIFLCMFIPDQLALVDQVFGEDFLMNVYNWNFLPEVSYYHVYFFLHTQICSVIMVSINRFIVVCYPYGKATKAYDRVPLWSLLPFNLAFALVCCFHAFFKQDINFFREPRTGQVIRLIDTTTTELNATQALIVTNLATLICTLCYAAVILNIWRARNDNVRTGAAAAKRNRELRLSAVGFSLFVVLVIVTVYYTILYVAADEGDRLAVRAIRNYYPFAIFLLCFVNPWVLLITSENTRRQVFFMRSAQNTPLQTVTSFSRSSSTRNPRISSDM